MDVEIYPVKRIGRGLLYVMPCPKAEKLERDLVQLRDRGITKLVSLLEPTEAEKWGVSHEADLCKKLGIAFVQFPIPDHKTPTNPKLFRQLIENLEQELSNGSYIAVHCLAGIGRTGLLAGSLLIKNGLTSAAATELLSDIRGCKVPQTHAQYNYLIDFETGEDQGMTSPKPRQKNWITRWLSHA